MTLTSFSAPAVASFDYVGYYVNTPQGGGDTVATMTLTVTAIPEPSTYAAILGFVSLLGVFYHRRRTVKA
ncbi:MAG: hypothetical protein PSW75_00380 [bacterium]|nr:hypothetical protein [bacterium]MDI1337985.1 hypothetical protein [Lacunisphaera sp.]